MKLSVLLCNKGWICPLKQLKDARLGLFYFWYSSTGRYCYKKRLLQQEGGVGLWSSYSKGICDLDLDWGKMLLLRISWHADGEINDLVCLIQLPCQHFNYSFSSNVNPSFWRNCKMCLDLMFFYLIISAWIPIYSYPSIVIQCSI